MKKSYVIAIIVAVASFIGLGTAIVAAQVAGEERTIDGGCVDLDNGGLRCAFDVAPSGSSPEGTCLPEDIMTHSDIHDDVTVWYADTPTGPRPIGYSTTGDCIHPY